MKKNLLIIIGLFIIGVTGGIFADQILWPYFVERPLFYQYKLEKAPVYVTEVREFTVTENTALTQAVAKVENSVVGVKTETIYGELLQGSGLIVTSDGLMITLTELVPQGSDFSFYFDEKQTSFQILKRDFDDNLALVKIGEGNLPTVGFANLDKLKLGERVFLVGQNMVNEGIVKTLDQDFIYTNMLEDKSLKGSALFNIQGEALGINTINASGEIITIPISKIKTFIGM